MENNEYKSIRDSNFFRYKPESKKQYKILHSYFESWIEAFHDGLPVEEKYDETLNPYIFSSDSTPGWHSFNEGRMTGMNLLLHDSYLPCFKGGNYDEEIVAHIESTCQQGITIFDVGGFMGVSSLIFGRFTGLGGLVCCFEPNPYNQVRILTNWSQNSGKEILNLYPLALSNEICYADMLMSDSIDTGYSSTSQLLNSHGTIPQSKLKDLGFFREKVFLTTMDDFVKKSKIIPHVIKIDVEGAEHYLIEGAIETFQLYSPILYIELHSPYSAMKSVQLLDSIGYDIQVLHEEDDKRLIVCCTRRLSENNTNLQIMKNLTLKQWLNSN